MSSARWVPLRQRCIGNQQQRVRQLLVFPGAFDLFIHQGRYRESPLFCWLVGTYLRHEIKFQTGTVMWPNIPACNRNHTRVARPSLHMLVMQYTQHCGGNGLIYRTTVSLLLLETQICDQRWHHSYSTVTDQQRINVYCVHSVTVSHISW